MQKMRCSLLIYVFYCCNDLSNEEPNPTLPPRGHKMQCAFYKADRNICMFTTLCRKL